MRDAFFSELATVFEADPRVVFITADLGYKLFDPLCEIDPRRVINAGLRETAMVGFAAGLALAGMRPFIYSIAPFATLRCLEQIKLDLCYHELPVVVVGVGGGFAYGPNGPTHHGVDDLAALSGLPNMRLWTPAGPNEVRACVRAAAQLGGPAYLRLGRNREPALRKAEEIGSIDGPALLADGDDIAIVSCGVILGEVLAAVEQLHGDGIAARAVHLPTLAPFPDAALAAAVNALPVLSVEEHMATGGLGGRVARTLARRGMHNRFEALAIPDAFPKQCMDRPASLAWAGIDAAAIAAACRKLCGRGA